jgi:hypothetical protein
MVHEKPSLLCWRMHFGVEVIESSNNKQHNLSLRRNTVLFNIILGDEQGVP